MTEEDDFDSEETELIITSHGETSMNAFETSTFEIKRITKRKKLLIYNYYYYLFINLIIIIVAARKEGDGYIEVIIGVLTAIMLLLLVVFLIILFLSRRHKLQGSPTLLRNPFGVTINMKVIRRLYNYYT